VGFVSGTNLQLYLKVWYIISEKKKGSNMMHYRKLGQTGMRVSEVYCHPELFEALNNLVKKGKLLNYGVSVEKAEEALKATEYPGVKTVQIIFNIFGHRPTELFFRSPPLSFI
jgi:aryl-alcohol dehydrogenase-like predicted oxidoreductase